MNERIKKIRKSLKLTQEEFGKKLTVTRECINKIEAGKEKPSRMLLKLVVLMFGVNEEWLLNGKGKMYSTHDSIIQNEIAHKMTSFEKIKAMSVEEMAVNITNFSIHMANVLRAELGMPPIIFTMTSYEEKVRFWKAHLESTENTESFPITSKVGGQNDD